MLIEGWGCLFIYLFFKKFSSSLPVLKIILFINFVLFLRVQTGNSNYYSSSKFSLVKKWHSIVLFSPLQNYHVPFFDKLN